MESDNFDVVIIGAGPAGSTAAILLAKKKHRVALVDRAKFPRPVTCSGWLSSASGPLLQELGRSLQPKAPTAFRDVTFYRADFTQIAKPTFESSPGFLIDREEFDQALVTAAVKEGVTFVPEHRAVDFKLMETEVAATLEGNRTLTGKLLLLASGRGTDLLDRVGVSPPSDASPRWLAQVNAPLNSKAAPRVGVVLGLDQGASFALCCVSKNRMSVTVNWLGERSQVIPTLVQVCRHVFEHKAVPLDLSENALSATVIQADTNNALDMDSHVGKHTLVIGEAGGFVSASSLEGIYPSMWSAQIAAGVADEALQSVHSQDVLMTFDSVWRMEMAEYLRSPHTDVQFLLPLIFTNQPMADRMGAAFFLGENI